jgi:hypothetical protein
MEEMEQLDNRNRMGLDHVACNDPDQALWIRGSARLLLALATRVTLSEQKRYAGFREGCGPVTLRLMTSVRLSPQLDLEDSSEMKRA